MPSRPAHVTLFVGAWMAIGLLLRLGSPRYQLLGVPLVVGFQLLVRRWPIRQLWVRNGPPFRLDVTSAAIGVVLLGLGFVAYQVIATLEPWVAVGWIGVYLIGTVAASYALRNLRADRRAWLYAGVAVVIGVSLLAVGAAFPDSPSPEPAVPLLVMVAAGLRAAALYVPASFVVEEVSFRGLVDAQCTSPESHTPGYRPLSCRSCGDCGTCHWLAAVRRWQSSPHC